jgi:hypothetical protein
MQLLDSGQPGEAANRCDWPISVEGETEVSIIGPQSRAIGAVEKVGIVKPAIVSAAVFIIVEIVLVAETIEVILLKEIDPRHPGAAPIAILLSMTLLANLGLVCGIAATIAANSARRAQHQRARALRGRFAVLSGGAEGVESADRYIAGAIDVPAPDPEDPAVEPVACSPTG